MYSDVLIEHFSNPRNVGVIGNADGYAKVSSSACGDLMELYIKVQDGRICEIRSRTFGCAAAIASSSIATEMAKGKLLTEVASLSDEDVAAALGGLSEAKIHCSSLAASALHAAIDDYYGKHPGERPGDSAD